MAVYVGGQVGSNVWLSMWSNDVFLPNNTAEELVAERLGVYAVLGFVQGTIRFSLVSAGCGFSRVEEQPLFTCPCALERGVA